MIFKNTIQFMRLRGMMLFISLALMGGSVALLLTKGLNFGIDFTGGTLIELQFSETTTSQQVRDILLDSEFANATVQDFGSPGDILIRLPANPDSDDAAASRLNEDLLRIFRGQNHDAEIRRIEFVGPQVGQELTQSGLWAMLYALGGILVYVALRFQLRFSVGAIAALIHDVILTVGAFSLFQLNFDLSVLAAVLAVIGYSLNDTIVIYDRVRENFHLMHKANSIQVVDTSLTQTLSRTLITSFTTILVLVALIAVGGEIIRPFAIALLIGVFVGTYSSIYIANPVILLLGISRKDLHVAEKQDTDSSKLIT